MILADNAFLAGFPGGCGRWIVSNPASRGHTGSAPEHHGAFRYKSSSWFRNAANFRLNIRTALFSTTNTHE
jgi:hypothetical protein